MSQPLRFDPTAILLDIEGTIASLPYVVNVMYPYVRDHLPGFVAAHGDEPAIRKILADTVALAGPGADPVESLLGWLAEDRKAPPLKTIQGLIWEEGYAEGAFQGQIYDDALAVLTRWHAAGVPLYIFSSGSVQCQVQFYEHNRAGDLRHLFTRHFDTDIGAKVETASYLRIAEAIGHAPERILFFSDNPRELVAATAAGLSVVHVLREDTPSDPRFPEIASFEEIELARLAPAA